MKKDDILDPGDLKDAHVRAYICGQCHSKGMSKDGATPWPHDFRPGDDLTAAFNHDTVNGPGQNQQLNDLMGSEHWKNNVVCETCHDPHGDTGNPDQLLKPVIELCLSCHSKPDNKSNVVDMATHMAKVGRKPPADATCASCHMPGGRHLFSKEAAKASDVGK
jgi:predicted CXXCH cytochrome family protein